MSDFSTAWLRMKLTGMVSSLLGSVCVEDTQSELQDPSKQLAVRGAWPAGDLLGGTEPEGEVPME